MSETTQTFVFFGCTAGHGSEAEKRLRALVDDYGGTPAPLTTTIGSRTRKFDDLCVILFGALNTKGSHYGVAVRESIVHAPDEQSDVLDPVPLDKARPNYLAWTQEILGALSWSGMRSEEVGSVGQWMVSLRA